jgi:bifunctional DNA-binding transcriptional regulator/antitoxin component of YhaV-PrlF toxin-antitoxin module
MLNFTQTTGMRTKMDAKGRIGLPQGAREEAGLPADVELVIRVVGPGRVLLLTRQGIEEDLYERYAGKGMGTKELVRWREEQAEIEEERFQDLLADRRPPQQEAS